MTAKPPLGKIQRPFFDRVIRPRLGREDPRLVVGPRNGVDVGVADLGNGSALVMTADPFYVMPQFGWEKGGWFAVHILASDFSTCGFAPQYLSVDLNLPPSMEDADIEALWDVVHRECSLLGITIATGHTGRYEGCDFPMVGGCTLLGVVPSDQYVTSGMSSPGDAVVVTKGPAIEASALMATLFSDRVRSELGEGLLERMNDLFWKMSTVSDALSASGVGLRRDGVTAMHDATEYGVLGGLHEMAEAAGVGMEIDLSSLPIPDDIGRICRLFDMDPLTSISEGTLLLTCIPEKAGEVVSTLEKSGIPAWNVGVCTDGGAVLSRDGKGLRPLEPPRVDPFWKAVARESGR